MIIFFGEFEKKRRRPDTFYPFNLINFIKVINFYPVFILSAKNNWIPNRQHSVRNNDTLNMLLFSRKCSYP